MAEARRGRKPNLSLVSRGARFQFAVGIALIAVIPALALWYLRVVAAPATVGFGLNHLVVAVLLILCAGGGYIILRKYPINIVRLRGYLEQMVDGELPDSVSLLKAEDDIQAVEQYLNHIIRQLREQLDAERLEKENLQHQLYQAQKMESLGVMAAGVAHDFNNYLTGILGNAEMVLEFGSLEGDAKETVHDIKKLATRASDLTKTMLTYSGRGKFVMEPLDMANLIDDLMKLLKASVGAGVKIDADVAGDIPALQGDPAQMRQVIMNLVMNGADAIGETGGTVSVAAKPAVFEGDRTTDTYADGRIPDGAYVCVEVRDDGCGMDAETVARIFDPFFTTKPEGRGLGLAVVLGIVRAHRGYMNVHSMPGKGTTFGIFLPVEEGLPAQEKAAGP
jgi:signal transduction histidine kinase